VFHNRSSHHPPVFCTFSLLEEKNCTKRETGKGHILLPDTVRFICEANGYDAEKIGQHFLEILPKICPPEQR